jgi:hypothetical protein
MHKTQILQKFHFNIIHIFFCIFFDIQDDLAFKQKQREEQQKLKEAQERAKQHKGFTKKK